VYLQDPIAQHRVITSNVALPVTKLTYIGGAIGTAVDSSLLRHRAAIANVTCRMVHDDPRHAE
jgi:hypothetical protein